MNDEPTVVSIEVTHAKPGEVLAYDLENHRMFYRKLTDAEIATGAVDAITRQEQLKKGV